MSVDFQRFESVRARRRSERRRWLSVLGVLAAAMVIVATVQVAGPTLPGLSDIIPSLSGASQSHEVRGRVDSIERDPDGRVRYHYSLIDYTAEAQSAELVPGDDAADARWFALDQLAGLGLWSETLRIIELARARRCR